MSDGKITDNQLKWDWTVKIVGELREMLIAQHALVAGDLPWYPRRGDWETRQTPNALVAFDRPPGYRDSYKQWDEDGVAPQVVFEVRSPSSTREEIAKRQTFYDKFGVEEYYLLDPCRGSGFGWVRRDGVFELVYPLGQFVSPRLGVRFEEENSELKLFTPEGREFRTREERVNEIQEELRRTSQAFEHERERALNALRWLSEERGRAEQEKTAKELLAAKLLELGIDPESVLRNVA